MGGPDGRPRAGARATVGWRACPCRAGGPGRVGRRARPPRTAVRPPRRPAPGVGRIPRAPGTTAGHTQVSVPGAAAAALTARSPWGDLWMVPARQSTVGNPQPGGPPTAEVTRGEQPEAGRPRSDIT